MLVKAGCCAREGYEKQLRLLLCRYTMVRFVAAALLLALLATAASAQTLETALAPIIATSTAAYAGPTSATGIIKDVAQLIKEYDALVEIKP